MRRLASTPFEVSVGSVVRTSRGGGSSRGICTADALAVRSLLRPSPDYASLVRRGALIWAQLFSFGVWRASTSPGGRALLQIAEFEPASSALRQWVAGMLEETARRAIGTDAKVTITGGEMGFTPELTCEIT